MRAAASVAALLSVAGLAQAAQGPVIVAVVRGAGAVTREAATRVRAELEAGGVRVVLVDVALDGYEAAARALVDERRGLGALTLRDAGGRKVSLLAWDASRARSVAQDVAVAPGAPAAAVLALHGLEVLRACLVNLGLPDAAPPPPATGPPPPSLAAAAAPRPLLGGLSITLAAAALHSFEGIGPSFAPAARVGVTRGRAAGRLTVVAGGTAAVTSSAQGRAEVRQDLAAAELVLTNAGVHPVVPFAAVGVGAYHVRIRGQADAPFTAAAPSLWTAAALGGGGLALRLGRHLAILTEVSWLLALRSPIVRIGTDETGRVGRASLLLSLGVRSAL